MSEPPAAAPGADRKASRAGRLLAVLAVCLLGLLLRRSSRPSSFNVVLISFDTLRADHLGCYGYARRPLSPNIDALARESILFESHIAAAPWTTPSHMSIFTARSPSGHGITQSMGELRTLFKSKRPYPALSAAQRTLPEILAAHGLAAAAFTGDVMVDASFGFGRGFAFYDTSMEKLDAGNMGRMASWIAAQRAPFFLFWHTYEPHSPYEQARFLPEVVPGDTAAKIAEDLQEARARGQRPDEPGILAAHGAFSREACTALYDGAIAASDRWLGEFVRALKAAGSYDRTVVVFTSDHGEQLGERPAPPGAPGAGIHDTHGTSLYEELVHVPLLIKLPRGARGGTRVSSLSRAIDVMPTILEALGIEGPPGLEGAPLQGLYRTGAREKERLAYSESLSVDEEMKSLRSARYKYILGIDKDSVARGGRARIPRRPANRELYDLLQDPGEIRNLLAGNPPEAVGALADRMDAALRRINSAVQSKDALGRAQVDPDVVERMRGLGYID